MSVTSLTLFVIGLTLFEKNITDIWLIYSLNWTYYEQFIGLVWIIPSNTVNEGNPSTALGLSSVLLCVQQECFHKLYPHNTFFFLHNPASHGTPHWTAGPQNWFICAVLHVLMALDLGCIWHTWYISVLSAVIQGLRETWIVRGLSNIFFPALRLTKDYNWPHWNMIYTIV